MKNILVTGANGQLGKSIQECVAERPMNDFNFIFLTRNEMDLCDAKSIESFFLSNEVYACINCAAYTAVDKAEDEVEKAFQINADAVETLARECKEVGAKFIHVSTDYVFDGDLGTPYEENHPTNPASVYGKSKLQGEERALAVNPDTLILRTAWVYSPYGSNFVKTMMRLMEERDELKVVSDQYGSPTYAKDLATTILHILKKNPGLKGIYHYSNEGETTWFEFASAIADNGNFAVDLHPIPTEDFPTPAKRPKYSLLSKKKIKAVTTLDIPHWADSLSDFFKNKHVTG